LSRFSVFATSSLNIRASGVSGATAGETDKWSSPEETCPGQLPGRLANCRLFAIPGVSRMATRAILSHCPCSGAGGVNMIDISRVHLNGSTRDRERATTPRRFESLHSHSLYCKITGPCTLDIKEFHVGR
jgi:hypothetical protein